jgi:mycofactocin precursor
MEYMNLNPESDNNPDDAEVFLEDLVEDVPIDGMCGVY